MYRYTHILVVLSRWTLLRSWSCSEISKHKPLLNFLVQDEKACVSLKRGCFWAVLGESIKACFSMEMLDSPFQVQRRDSKFLVIKLLCRTESYLFSYIYIKKSFRVKISSSCVCLREFSQLSCYLRRKSVLLINRSLPKPYQSTGISEISCFYKWRNHLALCSFYCFCKQQLNHLTLNTSYHWERYEHRAGKQFHPLQFIGASSVLVNGLG